MSRLDVLIEKASTDSDRFVIALIDIDHFKRINDNFGHSTGDAVLQHFSDTMRRCIRDIDWLGRVGGEEFLLVMQNASVNQIRKVLLRMRDALQDNPYRSNDIEICYTFSAGIARWQPRQALTEIYKAADRALYKAKLDGRNLIRVAKGENAGA